MPENLSTKISAPTFEVVTPTVIFPVNGLVPIPSVDFTVDTPTVILSIAILAFEVKSVAVVAVADYISFKSSSSYDSRDDIRYFYIWGST